MDEGSGSARARIAPWLVWFLVAFSLNAVLDLGLGLVWWVRWAVVIVTIPLAVVAWNTARRH